MKMGVVGLPNVGKSTLFNALTSLRAECANYPFCTIEPNVGIALVKDERLDELGKLFNTKKIINAVLEIVDIAGLVKGASKGEGLGNKFLSHIREVDAILHVVRCFEEKNITHVESEIDPIRDIEIINLELILADYEQIKKRREKAEKYVKTGDKKYTDECELCLKIESALEKGIPARLLQFSEKEREMVEEFFLLSIKPVLYCANISEKDINKDNELVNKVVEFAKKENSSCAVICANAESQLSLMEQEERQFFMEELGLKESGLDIIIKKGYELLGLISFLTAGEKETRAWTITRGTKAPKAASKIHTDFEKGFIRAEVVSYSDLIACKSFAGAKEKGKLKSEGKEYVVNDGDVIVFRFNV